MLQSVPTLMNIFLRLRIRLLWILVPVCYLW